MTDRKGGTPGDREPRQGEPRHGAKEVRENREVEQSSKEASGEEAREVSGDGAKVGREAVRELSAGSHRMKWPPKLIVGKLTIDPPILMAPMASLTTPAMRTVCEKMGCQFTFTEMVSVDGLVRRPDKLLRFISPSFNSDEPYGVQLVGRSPEEMAKAAEIAADQGVSVVDLNMGCPARKVVTGGNGAALMKNPEKAGRLVEAVTHAVGHRVVVTVKMRIGWDEDTLNGAEVARVVEKAGAKWITVHGRPRQQFCSGPVNYDEIARVVDAVDIPVIGNGGVFGVRSLETMEEKTGCQGVMVAQGALGNPWVFRDLVARWRGELCPPKVTLEERRKIMERHLDLYLQEGRDPHRTVLEMRKHLGWYSKGVCGGAAFRRKVFRLHEVDEVRAHIRSLGVSDH